LEGRLAFCGVRGLCLRFSKWIPLGTHLRINPLFAVGKACRWPRCFLFFFARGHRLSRKAARIGRTGSFTLRCSTVSKTETRKTTTRTGTPNATIPRTRMPTRAGTWRGCGSVWERSKNSAPMRCGW